MVWWGRGSGILREPQKTGRTEGWWVVILRSRSRLRRIKEFSVERFGGLVLDDDEDSSDVAISIHAAATSCVGEMVFGSGMSKEGENDPLWRSPAKQSNRRAEKCAPDDGCCPFDHLVESNGKFVASLNPFFTE